MIGQFFSALISPVTKIADKMILDKDKYAEIQLRKIELDHESRNKLLEITTTPKTDATVKLLIAFRDIVLPLLRPVGGAIMALFGMYCVNEGIEIPSEMQAVLFGAFPMWGLSRHVNKQTELKG